MLNLIIQIFTLLSFLAGVVTYLHAQRQTRKEEKRKAQQDTIEAYKALLDEALLPIDKATPSIVESYCKDRKAATFKDFRAAMMKVESFCIGLNEGIYDFDVFYKLAVDYFNNDRGSIKPTMKKFMELIGPEYYSNIQTIWKRMDEEH